MARSRVELFEQIRRDRRVDGLSIRELAERHRVHRRTVRQALASAVPPPRKAYPRRPRPAIEAYVEIIDGWLLGDRKVPRKQRHTARRVWQRLVAEHGATLAEVTVSRYVARRKAELGLDRVEVAVPQTHEPGAEAEVDFGEFYATVAGVWMKLWMFVMRLSHSGRAFHVAFATQAQEAFLEGHVHALTVLGGVPTGQVRYDNLRSAVKQVLKGRRRVESDRFVALRSHYLFEAEFTRPGKQGAHEKGGIEGEVGRFRRNHLVPVPQVADLGELNALLLAGCEADLDRRIVGREMSVGEALQQERPLLRALPAEPFDASETATPRVDAKSLVTVRQNRYSVPVCLAGLKVGARIGAREIAISHAGRVVARHERLHGRFGTSARLDHYLELLQRKPGGLEHSLALAQERERGAWPAAFDELWAALSERYGRSEAARQMVDVLMLCREHGPERVVLAVRGALAAGAHDGRAVAVLARRAQASGPPARLTDLDPRLAAHERPLPNLVDYDRLHDREARR